MESINILQLPIEILTIIVTDTLSTFKAAILVPSLGLKLCSEYSQQYAKSKFTEVKIFTNETKYYRAGKLHCDDGPAIVSKAGYEAYFINGKRHRVDGPARIWPNGQLEYFQNDVLHREDGPAIIFPDSYKAYYINGQRHREGGPARIWDDNTAEYYINNKLHREGGPALIRKDCVGYYLNGIGYSKSEYERLMLANSES
jgi:hypothetical protein